MSTGTDARQDDYVQWAIDHALSHWDPAELSANVITKRFTSLCFAAIQSSVITITNAVLDITASPHSEEYLDTMREEVLSELSAHSPESSKGPRKPAPSPWGKAALARMVHVDSALRESMRLNGFVARGIMKTVVAPGGVDLPDGTHVPQGTKVGIQAYSVHRDEAFYRDAETYEAFRFVNGGGARPSSWLVEGRRASASGSDTEGASSTSCVPRKTQAGSLTTADTGGNETRQPLALVTTSPTFLAFSHGPNSW
jgi:cytochrome P450